jgi:hypothetical protein
VWCGKNLYGKSCQFGPGDIHRHGSGSGCVWCGKNMHGKSCQFAPTEFHED